MKYLIVLLTLVFVWALAGCDIPLAAVTAPPTDTPTRPPVTASTTAPLSTLRSPTPAPVTPLSVVAPPAPVADIPRFDQLVDRTYTWEYGNKQWTWELHLTQGSYDYFKALPRSPTTNYSVYVTHPLDDPYLEGLAGKIQDAARQENYSEFETVAFAASFVQSLPYVPDNESTVYDEYPRYPIETLVDNGGDCEDTSILMASLVKDMGYGVVLLHFAATADSPGHLAVGVAGGEGVYGSYWEYAGRKYYYLETTGDGWGIGEVPDEYQSARATVYEMAPVPILTHTWESVGRPGAAEVEITISNLGSAGASEVYVYAGFDAGDDKMWNPEQSRVFGIGVGEKIAVTMTLRVPYDKHTRIVVQIVSGGYAVDESCSRWFET